MHARSCLTVVTALVIAVAAAVAMAVAVAVDVVVLLVFDNIKSISLEQFAQKQSRAL